MSSYQYRRSHYLIFLMDPIPGNTAFLLRRGPGSNHNKTQKTQSCLYIFYCRAVVPRTTCRVDISVMSSWDGNASRITGFCCENPPDSGGFPHKMSVCWAFMFPHLLAGIIFFNKRSSSCFRIEKQTNRHHMFGTGTPLEYEHSQCLSNHWDGRFRETGMVQM